MESVTKKLWQIVLAGGSGARLRPLTGGVPKQFWRPGGRPSLLDTTLRRMAPLVAPDRTVIVVADGLQPHLEPTRSRSAGRIAVQPADRGTAAGVLFGLVPVLIEEPDAVVIVAPSDHGVRDADAFRKALRRGVSVVDGGRDEVVLFGLRAEQPDVGYGWISTRPATPMSDLHEVRSFIEKPGLAAARRLCAAGALINTMIVAARARRLLHLFRKHVPTLAAPFVGALTLPPRLREAVLRDRYPALAPRDLSRDVLARADGLLVQEIAPGAGWSDLGTPDRWSAWMTPGRDAASADPGRIEAAIP